MATPTLSLLSGEEIKSLALVENCADENLYRASTYDLSVAEIIPAENVPGTSEYDLPPGGTVRVVSKESLKLPNNITGHALLKNELCRKGVLALNIGVIDPGFEGPISSTLINFGRGNFVVKQGAPFLRISFHRCLVSPKANKSSKYSRQEYVSRVKDEAAAYMASSFLNVEGTAKKAAETAFVSFKEGLVIWATIVAVLLGLLAIFAPLGASYVEKYVVTRDQGVLKLEQESKKKLQEEIERNIKEQYDTRFKTLTDQVEELKRTTTERSRQSHAPAGKP